MKINALRLMAAAGMMGVVMVPSAAFADYGTTPSTVCVVDDAARAAVTCETTTTDGGTDELGDTTTSEAATATTTSSAGGDSLPFTGGDIAGATLVGLGLAAGGTVLVRANRRRATA